MDMKKGTTTSKTNPEDAMRTITVRAHSQTELSNRLWIAHNRGGKLVGKEMLSESRVSVGRDGGLAIVQEWSQRVEMAG